MIDVSAVSSHSVVGRVLRWPLGILPRGRSVPILQGPMRGMRWTIGAGTHGCWLGTYEWRKQQAFAAAVTAGQVVYDLGANAGIYTLLAARNVTSNGRVIAFEPLPANAAILRRHVALNELGGIVQVLEAAVSDRSGEALFSPGPDPSMGHLSDSGATGSVRVRVVTLDQLWAGGGIPAPDHIKIDVEGAEFAALRGATDLLQHTSPRIWLATHGSEVRDHCISFLEAMDYEVSPLHSAADRFGDEFVAVAREA